MVDWVNQLPQIATAAGVLALAALLLSLAPHHRANRVFALLLFLRGVSSLTYSFGTIADDAETARFWWDLFPYPLFFIPFVALYFALVYPHARGSLGRSSWAGAAFLGAGALVSFAYALEPALFWDLEEAGAGLHGPEEDAPAGPLFVFDVLIEVAYAVVAIAFAQDWVKASPQNRSRSPILISFAFSAVVLYNSLSIPLDVPRLLLRHGGLLSAAMVTTLLLAFALVLGLACNFVWHSLRNPEVVVRQGARRYVGLLALPVLSVGLLLALPDDYQPATPWLYLMAGLWRLALPVLVTYGLLRHHLFDIDLKVKWTLKHFIIAVPFAGVFFLASEGLEELVPTEGLWLGLGAAALLALALKPIENFAGHVVDRMMPDVQSTGDYVRARKLEVYRDAVEGLLADGTITAKERRVLEQLKTRLGLHPSEARRLEQDARGAKGLPSDGGVGG